MSYFKIAMSWVSHLTGETSGVDLWGEYQE